MNVYGVRGDAAVRPSRLCKRVLLPSLCHFGSSPSHLNISLFLYSALSPQADEKSQHKKGKSATHSYFQQLGLSEDRFGAYMITLPLPRQPGSDNPPCMRLQGLLTVSVEKKHKEI